MRRTGSPGASLWFAVRHTGSPGASLWFAVRRTGSPGASLWFAVRRTGSPGASLWFAVRHTGSPGASLWFAVRHTGSPGASHWFAVRRTGSPGASLWFAVRRTGSPGASHWFTWCVTLVHLVRHTGSPGASPVPPQDQLRHEKQQREAAVRQAEQLQRERCSLDNDVAVSTARSDRLALCVSVFAPFGVHCVYIPRPLHISTVSARWCPWVPNVSTGYGSDREFINTALLQQRQKPAPLTRIGVHSKRTVCQQFHISYGLDHPSLGQAGVDRLTARD